MTDQHYAVVFSGRITDGSDAQQVRANLATLFKVDIAKIEPMFSGKPVIVKKDLPAQRARSYQAALAKAGAVAELVSTTPATSATPVPQSQASTQQPTPAASTKANEPPSPPQAPNLTIAEAGAILVEATPTPPAKFDTTGLDLAEIGATLAVPKPVAPAEFDITGFDLEPVGGMLSEPRTVAPADFDTSGLSLVEDN